MNIMPQHALLQGIMPQRRLAQKGVGTGSTPTAATPKTDTFTPSKATQGAAVQKKHPVRFAGWYQLSMTQAQVQRALRRGAINDTHEQNYTALTMAAQAGKREIVEFLLAKGANIEHKTHPGYTALMLAAFKGHPEVAELLLAKGADIHNQTNSGHTALMLAAQAGKRDVVELLLSKGADIDHQTSLSHTALTMAAQAGKRDVVELLLAKGANIEHKTNLGHTALTTAAEEGEREIVELLLAKGANIEHQTNLGHTALMMAAFRRHPEMVKLLLAKGADGISALEWAERQGLTEIIDLLKAAANLSPAHAIVPASARSQSAALQRFQDFEKLETLLRSRIIGQDQALNEILDLVEQSYVMQTPRFKRRFKAGMPRSVTLLAGPSGVGKTETVKLLKTLGNRDMVRLQGDQYNDDIKTNLIMGSAPGYAGHGEPTVVDQLIEKCQTAKDAGNAPPLLLIDELDKAAPRFFTIWNAALAEGLLGRQHVRKDEGWGSKTQEAEQLKVDFRNVDVICTANFAQKEIVDILQGKEEISTDDRRAILEAVKKDSFNRKGVMPDFWSRFNAIIPFKPLSTSSVKKISENLLAEDKATYLEDNGIQLEVHPDVLEKVALEGNIAQEGCRRVIDDLSETLNRALKPVFRTLVKNGRFQPVASPEQADRIEIRLDEAGKPKAFLTEL